MLHSEHNCQNLAQAQETLLQVRSVPASEQTAREQTAQEQTIQETPAGSTASQVQDLIKGLFAAAQKVHRLRNEGRKMVKAMAAAFLHDKAGTLIKPLGLAVIKHFIAGLQANEQF